MKGVRREVYLMTFRSRLIRFPSFLCTLSCKANEMEGVKILKIAELAQRGIPVTGTNAVNPPLRSIRISSKPNLRFTSSSPSASTDSHPNPKILTPLNFPAIIITVIGSLIDSHSVRNMLKEHNIQLETLQPMANVLASEVRHTDSLNEARKIMLELRDG